MGTFKVCNREYPWHARLFPWTLFAGSRGGNPRGKSCFSLGAQRFSRGGFSSFSHPRLKDREPIPARSGNGVSAGWMKMKRVTSEFLKEPLRKAGMTRQKEILHVTRQALLPLIKKTFARMARCSHRVFTTICTAMRTDL